MTKFAKISLVAAVAVEGLTTANAQPLEEAIKGVDVSGMMRYRFESIKDGNSVTGGSQVNSLNNANANAYRLDVKTSAKVNDAVKANVTVGITGNNGSDTTLSTESSDAVASVGVRDANFAISLAGATVIAGKQSVPGPFVDNTSDDITRGTGVVALLPLGAVTLAAGSFNNTTVGGYDASEAAVIANLGGVAADVWYANVANVDGKDLTMYSVHANTTLAGLVNVDARYSSKDNKVANADKATLTKVIASGKVEGITLAAGYFKSGKNNATTNNVSIDGDNDAAVDARVWQASVGRLADATGLLAVVGVNLTPELSAKLSYADVKCDAIQDGTETLVDIGYAMSKNFTLSGKYSIFHAGALADDSVKSRIEAKYTF